MVVEILMRKVNLYRGRDLSGLNKLLLFSLSWILNSSACFGNLEENMWIKCKQPKHVFSYEDPAVSCLFSHSISLELGIDLAVNCIGLSLATQVQCCFMWVVCISMAL